MKIAAITQNQQYLDDIRQFLADLGEAHQLFFVHGDVNQIVAVAEQVHPDLLFLEGSCHDKEELQNLGRATSRFPGMGVVLLCPTQTPDFLIEAMRVGVREVLATPPARPALLEAVDRFQQRIAQAQAPDKRAKVLAFIPCKGGSGATFLATNIAYALAALENQRVALFDFNLQFGDASLFVHDQPPRTSIADVARQIQRVDGAFLWSSMIQVLPNFGVLAAPEEPEKAVEVKPEHVGQLLQVAIRHYDFVVMDIGRVLDAVSVRALDHADMIFPVLQQTLPFIRDAKRLMNVFRSLGYPNEKIRLFVNRYEKGGEITLADVEDTLSVKVFRTIPNSFAAVAQSVNQGVPVIKLARRDPVSRELHGVAHDLVHGIGQGGGWLRNLFSS